MYFLLSLRAIDEISLTCDNSHLKLILAHDNLSASNEPHSTNNINPQGQALWHGKWNSWDKMKFLNCSLRHKIVQLFSGNGEMKVFWTVMSISPVFSTKIIWTFSFFRACSNGLCPGRCPSVSWLHSWSLATCHCYRADIETRTNSKPTKMARSTRPPIGQLYQFGCCA